MTSQRTASRWLAVVLCHNEHPELVTACLRSVVAAAQLLCREQPGTSVAVRVVDDSRPKAREKWQSQVQRLGVELLSARGSIAQKRNAGIRGTDADIVAFTDADCEVCPDWLLAHARAYAHHPEAPGVAGRTLHEVTGARVYRAAEYAGFLIGFAFPELMRETLWAPCSNLSLRLSLLRQIGGFDERFAYSAEDVDLGLRLHAAAERGLVCIVDGPVRHAPQPFSQGVYRRCWTWGAAEARLLSRHSRHRVFAPPREVLFFGAALVWAFAKLFWQYQFGLLACFLAVYVMVGPWLEAREARLPWDIVIRSRVLRGLFDLRTCLSLLALGRPHLLLTAMNYGEGQFAAEWPRQTRRVWEFLTFLLLAGLVV